MPNSSQICMLDPKMRASLRHEVRRTGTLFIAQALVSLVAATLQSPSLAQSNQAAGGTPRIVEAEGMRLNVTTEPIAKVNGTKIDFELKFQIRADNQRVSKDLASNSTAVKLRSSPLSQADVILRPGKRESARVILALDTSGSMVMQSSRWNTTKFAAAKAGVVQFLESMSAGDSVEIITFDGNVQSVYPLTLESEQLRESRHQLGDNLKAAARAVEALRISADGSANFTSLYQAIEIGLLRAKRLETPNLVVITDGMDDTPERRAPGAGSDECSDEQGQYQTYVRQRELQIGQQAGFVRTFTIGVGDSDAAPCDLGWANMDTLHNISTSTGAGSGNAIRLQELEVDSNGKPSRDALQRALSETLNKIRENFVHDYVLQFRVDGAALQAGTAEPFRIEVRTVAPDGRAVNLPLEFTYQLPGTGKGDVGTPGAHGGFSRMIPRPADYAVGSTMSVLATVGNPTQKKPSEVPSFLPDFLRILFAIGLLALPPQVVRWYQRRKAERFSDAVVVRLERGSPHIGSICPNESRQPGGKGRMAFAAGDYAVVCPSCKTPHHIACWSMGNTNRCWRCRCQVRLSAAAMNHIDD